MEAEVTSQTAYLTILVMRVIQAEHDIKCCLDVLASSEWDEIVRIAKEADQEYRLVSVWDISKARGKDKGGPSDHGSRPV